MDSQFTYIVSNAALTGIMILPVLVIWVLFLFQARRRQDPVRDGVAWLKASFFFFFLSLIITTASDGAIAAVINDPSNLTASTFNSLVKASDYLSIVAGYLEQLSIILTLVALIELAYGFYVALQPAAHDAANSAPAADATKGDSGAAATRGEDSRLAHHKMVRIATAVVGVVLLALSTAWFGKGAAAYVKYNNAVYSDNSDNSDSSNASYNRATAEYVASVRIGHKLGGAFDILVFVLSLPLLGAAGYLVSRAQGLPIKNTTVLYLVAVVFWFIRFLWRLVYNAVWLLPPTTMYTPLWLNVVDPLLNVWTFVITIILLYIVGVRRAGGLWSTPQPWTQFAADGMYGGGYQPGVAPAAGAPYQYNGYNGYNVKNNNANYGPVPPGAPVYQLPGHEAPRQQFHEMPNPAAAVYPQEMYAPQMHGSVPPQQYQPYPPPAVASPPQGHVAPETSPSPLTESANGVNATPPPPSGTSASPPAEVKA
ncbi:hypothetical protein SPBR_04242 [Sporothrix brasiliensis 5110]|uniref:Uncharacterized protein n=1 Tax=Sporothrix brasiliensis 5110 TaxID=1398154 RepID=A0A0C2J3H9_9PEZI|nr:uncharacterized protein SPBR_04242 [Sporothrix brasiliensis 5110]KIH93580.1 hypothetical protein SPBR_04242 [Sporothrix brasiliensis 5110]